MESGRRVDRPQLVAALAACRTRRAVLLIAKLDRLARNARFLLSVVEGSGEAGVVFCDLSPVPAGPVGKFLVSQMAAVAGLEAGLISQRTRAALAVAKARGVTLGNPRLVPGTAAMAAVARQRAAARWRSARPTYWLCYVRCRARVQAACAPWRLDRDLIDVGRSGFPDVGGL